MLTPPQLAWRAAGMPHPIDKFTISQHKGTCSTCGHAINGDAVIISSFDNKAFSAHAESFRFGGTHVCMACGWLYGAGPSKPGNFIATPAKYELAVISLESVVEGKRPWLEILRELASMPRHGAWGEWARCYPDLWARWVNRWPEIRALQ